MGGGWGGIGSGDHDESKITCCKGMGQSHFHAHGCRAVGGEAQIPFLMLLSILIIEPLSSGKRKKKWGKKFRIFSHKF